MDSQLGTLHNPIIIDGDDVIISDSDCDIFSLDFDEDFTSRSDDDDITSQLGTVSHPIVIRDDVLEPVLSDDCNLDDHSDSKNSVLIIDEDYRSQSDDHSDSEDSVLIIDEDYRSQSDEDYCVNDNQDDGEFSGYYGDIDISSPSHVGRTCSYTPLSFDSDDEYIVPFL